MIPPSAIGRRAALAAAGAALLAPERLRAQAAGRVPRVVVMSNVVTLERLQAALAAPEPVTELGGVRNWSFVFDELRRRGWQDGETVDIDLWSAALVPATADRVTLIREMLTTPPDLILTDGSAFVQLVMAETATIPIVASMGDPLDAGIADSLARPRGNVTGWASTNLMIDAKRIQMLVEIAPHVRRVAYGLIQRMLDLPSVAARLPEVVASLADQGIEVVVLPFAPPASGAAADIRTWQDGIAPAVLAADCQGLCYYSAFGAGIDQALLAQSLIQARLPYVGDEEPFVLAGGLMSYTYDREEFFRGLASYAAQVLQGTHPADLPFQYATKYNLIINRKTADALGLSIPLSLEILATQIVE